MTTVARISSVEVKIANGDVRTIQRHKTWQQFEYLQKGFENTRGIRLFYYCNTIEILMPSEAHELFKTILGMLIETYLLDREIEFKPTGSMTQKLLGTAAAEADESYQIDGMKLSIEINFTSGDESKLDCYLALGVDEVWFWEDGKLAAYHLDGDRYQQVSQSQIPALKSLNLAILSQSIIIGETSRLEAVKFLRVTNIGN
jgi:Uma2 family endonuclease